MARVRVISVSVLLFVGLATVANASVITINPNDYTLGTDLSTMFEGLTMARLTNGGRVRAGDDDLLVYNPIAAAVYAIPSVYTDGALSVGGSFSYTYNYEGCEAEWFGSSCNYRVLELLFADPTDFVQIESHGGSDYPGFLAYDRDGNRLGGSASTYRNAVMTVTANDSSSYMATLTLLRGQRDISRVVFGGVIGASIPTQISYRVPEPSTMLFMSMGALFLFSRRP